eukprot:CAMPEP_0117614718 /NCGR_PEP_ID=MMETSP0784-20121206/84180_1 /TAXON_ID=39447 /ORGANISM="" /LENGTH=75 /DNA_ID=CAMNT_0005418455 /DNA_START=124 /DNA_END=351 /DNA_ORIENTATION=-
MWSTVSLWRVAATVRPDVPPAANGVLGKWGPRSRRVNFVEVAFLSTCHMLQLDPFTTRAAHQSPSRNSMPNATPL